MSCLLRGRSCSVEAIVAVTSHKEFSSPSNKYTRPWDVSDSQSIHAKTMEGPASSASVQVRIHKKLHTICTYIYICIYVYVYIYIFVYAHPPMIYRWWIREGGGGIKLKRSVEALNSNRIYYVTTK